MKVSIILPSSCTQKHSWLEPRLVLPPLGTLSKPSEIWRPSSVETEFSACDHCTPFPSAFTTTANTFFFFLLVNFICGKISFLFYSDFCLPHLLYAFWILHIMEPAVHRRDTGRGTRLVTNFVSISLSLLCAAQFLWLVCRYGRSPSWSLPFWAF